MSSNLLNKIYENIRPVDWEKFVSKLRPRAVSYINNQPIYEFYDTLNDSLEISVQSLSISVQPPQSFIPYHIHNYVEITFPAEGNLTVGFHDRTIHMSKYDVLIVGKHVPHRNGTTTKHDKIVSIALKDAAFTLNDFNFMRSYMGSKSLTTLLFSLLFNEDDTGNNYYLFNTQSSPKIMDILLDILMEYYYPDDQSNQLIQLEVTEVFTRLIRLSAEKGTLLENQSHHTPDLMPILIYIEQNYATVSLTDLADKFGFNPNYLSSYLEKKTGKTFIKLVQLQRVNAAAEFLTYTNATIENIAIKVGYENPSYFYKIFKKTMSESPSSYRIRSRKV